MDVRSSLDVLGHLEVPVHDLKKPDSVSTSNPKAQTVSHVGCAAIHVGANSVKTASLAGAQSIVVGGVSAKIRDVAMRLVGSTQPDTVLRARAQPISSRQMAFHVMTRQGKAERVEARAQESLHLPPDTVKKFMAWRAEKQATNSTFFTAPHRIPYKEEDVAIALHLFAKECGCSWHQMKHHWAEKPGYMQVINDLRGMEIERISTQLKKEFPGLQIFDFGSNNVKSDRDLSLSISAHPEKEVDAVKRYNALFAESGWGATAAKIFDNNAYTQLYIHTVNQADQVEAQQSQQNLMSLVMYRRNAGEPAWEKLKLAAKSGLIPTQAKEVDKQFTLVESSVHEIELMHQSALLEKGITKASSSTWLEVGDLVRQLERAHPDLVIAVDNALHDQLKQEIQEIVQGRSVVNLELHKITSSSDPKQILESYQHATQVGKEFLSQQMRSLEKQWTQLQKEAGRVGEMAPEKAVALRLEAKQIKAQMELLKAKAQMLAEVPSEEETFAKASAVWGHLREKEKQMQDAIKSLETLPVKLEMMQKQWQQLLANPTGVSVQKFQELQEKMTLTQKEIEGAPDTRKHLSLQLIGIQEEMMAIPQKMCGYLDALAEVSDRMQLAAEANQMKAQCFAQEAHVTAGAFGFVVEDIQKGSDQVRTLSAYAQGMNELMGFYHAHQGHASFPEGKMVEVSKYVGPRLMEGYARMTKLAETHGLIFPTVTGWNDVQNFFQEIFPLRSGKIPESIIRRGLEQIQDPKLRAIQKELFRCKSQVEVQNLLQEQGLEDRAGQVMHFYPLTEKGGVSETQLKQLVRVSAIQNHMPMNSKGEVDTQKIDDKMHEMQGKMLGWFTTLSSSQKF